MFFITDRCQKTIVTKSHLISFHQGVPQGNVLRLLIFYLYINDLNSQQTYSCKVVLYAIDTIIFCDDKIVETALRDHITI